MSSLMSDEVALVVGVLERLHSSGENRTTVREQYQGRLTPGPTSLARKHKGTERSRAGSGWEQGMSPVARCV